MHYCVYLPRSEAIQKQYYTCQILRYSIELSVPTKVWEAQPPVANSSEAVGQDG